LFRAAEQTSDSYINYVPPPHSKSRNASFESPGRAKKVLEEHKAIYEAVVARDADRAEQMTKEHVKNASIMYKRVFKG